MTISESMDIEIESSRLAEILLGEEDRPAVIVDCRCFTQYNALHIRSAVNAFYSKLMRKRIETNKVDSQCLLGQILGSCSILPTMMDLVLYADSESEGPPARICHKRRLIDGGSSGSGESSAKMIRMLREKLEHTNVFNNIMLLKGGFNSFRSQYPELCESSAIPPDQGVVTGTMAYSPSRGDSFGSLSRASLSQPCLPQGGDGPTQILPFLYLGSQQDALNHDTLKRHNITYVLNLSLNCPKADILQSEDHFLRIPVNDNYQEKLLPYFYDAYKFLEKVRERGAVVLIHCLAGISRSPTVAISYIMRHQRIGSDEAYKFVKSKRQSISPNFNFMGQLLEYERVLRDDGILPPKNDNSNTPSFTEKQDYCPAKVPKSCSAMSLFSSLPSSLSTFPPSSEETLPPNEHGKRGMGPVLNTERPGLLEGTALGNPTRPVALGLKSRKPVVIPSSLGEELPSPSSELSKLTFSSGLPYAPSVANPCFNAQEKTMKPLMTQSHGPSSGGIENPTFGRMVPSIPTSNCRGIASNRPIPPQREIESLAGKSNPHFDSISTNKTPQQPIQIEEKKEKDPPKESPRSRFPMNFFALFRKPDHHGSEKIPRSQTASAGLSSFASRPECLAEAGVARDVESRSPPRMTPMTGISTETDSPESGFQEEYKTSPEQDPDRTSIGSTSSHEIAVQ